MGRRPEDYGWGGDDGRGVGIARDILDNVPHSEIQIAQATLPVGEFPGHLLHVPGLVGDIASWIAETSSLPQPALSLGAALTIVGTAAGRHMAGPTISGTHLYIIVLAPSGAGKDHPRAMVGKILEAAEMQAHIGPAEFISMPALIRFLARVPLSVCPMDEFGSFLKRINNRKASGFEGAISGMLRSAWGQSFKTMTTPEWAGRQMEAIRSPALSIYGVSTPQDFYSSLDGADVINGVLNRFILLESGSRPPERQPPITDQRVPGRIVVGLKAIYQRRDFAQLLQSRIMPSFDTLAISPAAETVRMAFVREVRAMAEERVTLSPFLARTAENAIRLATIVAIGRGSMTIEEGDMTWANEVAIWSTQKLSEGASLYIADSETQQIANALRRAIWPAAVKRMDLIRGLKQRYRTRDIEDVLKSLAEAEEIVIEKHAPGPKGGPPATWYRRAT
jgi:hypothetical protein